ncbi:MAG: hypothetical protein ACWGQW_03225 [bacterium]
MIHERLSFKQTVQTEAVLELNHVALKQLLVEAGYKLPKDVKFQVRLPGGGDYSGGELEIDFDTMLEVVWTETTTRNEDFDSQPEIKEQIELAEWK